MLLLRGLRAPFGRVCPELSGVGRCLTQSVRTDTEAAHRLLRHVFTTSASYPRALTAEEFQKSYERSVGTESDAFWGEQAVKRLEWHAPFTKVKEVSLGKDGAAVDIKWFVGGKLNASVQCVDRHVRAGRGEHPALIWERDNGDAETVTYGDLQMRVGVFANVLKRLNITKGDRVSICMPNMPDAVVAMLACARIGAIHSFIFAGFSSEAIASRISDCKSKAVIVTDQAVRGGKKIPIKNLVDDAIESLDVAERPDSTVVVRLVGDDVVWNSARDRWYHELSKDADAACAPTVMDADDPLFILYTSGSTGPPKGVLHTTGGYLLQTGLSHECAFDYRHGDIHWCTADLGWVTGHSYMVYGPLGNGATSVLYEGVPTYPSPSRFWDVVDKHKVTQLYTSPTALRALKGHGDQYVRNSSRKSLRVLGTVGEPINPEAWQWFHDVVGDSRCPIVDTWWQTETGSLMMAPIPGVHTEAMPGCATAPFLGVVPQLVDDDGTVLHGNDVTGNLVFEKSWPSMIRSCYGNHQRFEDTYFRAFNGKYASGDRARRDQSGRYWITGRVDDVINVSGHRLGTAEVESAVMKLKAITKCAVVGYPHAIKGTGIYVFAVAGDAEAGAQCRLQDEIRNVVRATIGPIATPDIVQFTPALPENRAGKTMRRLLRKIAADEAETPGAFGDTSTLLNPEVLEIIQQGRRELPR